MIMFQTFTRCGWHNAFQGRDFKNLGTIHSVFVDPLIDAPYYFITPYYSFKYFTHVGIL